MTDPLHPLPDRLTDLPFVVFGRRAKPQALATVIGLIGVTLGPFNPGDYAEVFDFDSVLGLLMAVFGFVVVMLLTVAWWLCSGRLLRAGLFGAVVVFASRAFLAGFTVGTGHPATWISTGFTIGVGWAWLMERSAARSAARSP